MPRGKGYGENSMYGGSTKSHQKSAYGNDKGGNYGKPIGDTGSKTRKGNKRSRLAADRYK